MKNITIFAAVILFAAAIAPAQSPSPNPVPEQTVIVELPRSTDLPLLDGMRPGTAQSGYTRPTAEARRKRYIKSMIGPVALARTAASAGWSTWRNSPEEWGDDWEGFGRRVASGMGKNVIKQTTIYSLDEALKIDSGFYRSKNRSTGSKIKNALISPVTARNREGKRVIGISRIAGTYTAGIVAAEAWYPARYSWKDGVKSGTMSLGMNAAFNLFKEFVWKK